MKLEHIGIAVTSLDEAAATYRDGFGLEISGYEEIEDDGARVAMIPIGETRIELIESTQPDSPIDRFVRKRGPGLHHLAIQVDDIDQTLDQLRAAGARLVDETPRAGAGGTRIAFLHPSSAGGVLLELVEHAK